MTPDRRLAILLPVLAVALSACVSAASGSDAKTDAATAEQSDSGAKIIRKEATVAQRGTYIRILVNNEPITNFEVQRRAKFRQLRRLSANTAETERELIDESLKMQEAKARNVLVIATDSEVSSRDALYVGIDQKAWAMRSAEWLAKTLDGEGSIVAINGVPGHPANQKRVAGYREVLRVARRGGRFFAAVWDEIAYSPISATVHEAVARRYAGDPPQFLARTPHGYHDAARIRADLAAAGFASIAIETVTLPSRAASARDPAIGFCQASPLRAEI